jgi:hypothetical protein
MERAPDTYAFRWAGGLRLVLGLAAIGMLAGVAGIVWGVLIEPSSWWLLVVAGLPVLLGAAFVAVFAARLPSAFVAIRPAGVRILFPLSVDTTISFDDIERSELVNHYLIYGLGIRTNLMGHVALATASGPAAELKLRRPVRAGILPRIWWTHARELRLTIEQPQAFVEQLNAALERGQEGARG